ncbi:MAG: dodecin family protein [Maricaulaceae bacterium]|jgi:flavin-binding protein dodecin
MTILKSEQILADSAVSWDDAVESAVERFSKTVRNVRSAYVNEFTTVVEHGKVRTWRVNLQVTFEVDEPRTAAPARASRSRAAGSKAKTKKK